MLNVLNCDIKDQDQLLIIDGELLFTAGADYLGDKNYLYRINKDGKCRLLGPLKNSYAVEGMVFIDDSLYVFNDGYYHDAKIKKNYVAVYTNVLNS